ncbi:MAG: hypothetical protein JOZ92_06890 [Candidatus Dormibacteraeota bacterium]|nr:hypothetical protein [Candidatus Dormibacteraeota bacterium]
MLIQDFVQIERRFDEVAAALLADPAKVLYGAADTAYSQGERLSMRLTPSLSHPRIGKRVHVDLGRPLRTDDRVVVPLHWWASGATALFPRLDADLEIAPLGAQQTQLTLMGRYDPPFSVVGRHADSLLLHRVAEGCVRTFLTLVALRVGSAESPQSHAPRPLRG